MDGLLPKAEVDSEIFFKIISIVSYYGIDRICDLILQNAGKSQYFISLLDGNDLQSFGKLLQLSDSELLDELKQARQIASKKVFSLRDLTNRKLVLHFDELQYWHVPRPGYIRIKQGKIDKEEANRQLLIVFCYCLQEIFNSLSFRLIFSGKL